MHFVSDRYNPIGRGIQPDENKPQKEHEKKSAIVDKQLAKEDAAKVEAMDAKKQERRHHGHERHKEQRHSK